MLQCRLQRINRQMARVGGLMRQATDGGDDGIASDCSGFSGSQSDEHLCQGGAASDGGDTSSRTIAGLGDACFRELQCELHDVAAGGILHAHTNIRVRDLAYVAGVLKVVKQLGGVHAEIVVEPKLGGAGAPARPTPKGLISYPLQLEEAVSAAAQSPPQTGEGVRPPGISLDARAA